MKIVDTPEFRMIRSEEYNRDIDKRTGNMSRWGKTKDSKNDPQWSPIGPELLDIEITTICSGIGDYGPCPWCYKSNTTNGKYMTLDTFKAIMDKMKLTITNPKDGKTKDIHSFEQIAFGVDAKCESNPEWWDIFKYTKSIGITPNVTVADISDDTANKLASVCGAVAVSRYQDKDICYNTIKKLTDRGMTQVNIHILVAEFTYDRVMETLKDRLTDPRLSKLNAIVLLSLKQKGRGKNYLPLAQNRFSEIIKFSQDNNISIGMDSCSAHKAMEAFKDHPDFENIKNMIEPCEVCGFSSYIDVNGVYFPCSFAEGAEGWKEGMDVLGFTNFLNAIWHSTRLNDERKKLQACGRRCIYYTI